MSSRDFVTFRLGKNLFVAGVVKLEEELVAVLDAAGILVEGSGKS